MKSYNAVYIYIYIYVIAGHNMYIIHLKSLQSF